MGKFGNKKIKYVEGNFEFKNVCFGYNERIILKNFNFKTLGKLTLSIKILNKTL